MLGYVYALQGERDKALQTILKIQSDFPNKHSIKIARIFSALENKNIALEYLEKAFEEHEIDLTALNSDPRWAKIKSMPQFKELLKRIGIPN
jgi:tetratricopeptide (TPR) repeat protein